MTLLKFRVNFYLNRIRKKKEKRKKKNREANKQTKTNKQKQKTKQKQKKQKQKQKIKTLLATKIKNDRLTKRNTIITRNSLTYFWLNVWYHPLCGIVNKMTPNNQRLSFLYTMGYVKIPKSKTSTCRVSSGQV